MLSRGWVNEQVHPGNGPKNYSGDLYRMIQLSSMGLNLVLKLINLFVKQQNVFGEKFKSNLFHNLHNLTAAYKS